VSGLTERITKRSSRMFDKIEPGEGLLPTPKSAQKPLKVFGLFVVAGVATMAAGIAVTYLEIGPLMLPKVHMPSHLNQVRAGSAVAHPNPSGNVSLLPEWIERGITQTTKKLEKLILENRTMSLNLQSVNASNSKRLTNPPLRVGADQANAVFFQFQGKSSWSRLLGQVGSFSSTSQRYAKGSTPFSLHVSMML